MMDTSIMIEIMNAKFPSLIVRNFLDDRIPFNQYKRLWSVNDFFPFEFPSIGKYTRMDKHKFYRETINEASSDTKAGIN